VPAAAGSAATDERPSAVEPAGESAGLHAVLVNGGGRRQINYYSHVDHVRRMVALLGESGVEPTRITIFSADGEDAEPDLATRDGELPPELWLLPTRIANSLRPPIVYVNSEVEGFELRPATVHALRAWFSEEGQKLGAGDTLLFYVTDHGEKNGDDLADNSITLWGEKLHVRELRGLLGLLDPGVRVVMLMSQCYSGSFANAIFDDGADALPSGNVCGYFSTTADRKATGCYPEVSGKEDIGHSYRMLAALRSEARLSDAHREVLLTDRSPDVPLRTSDFLLERRLDRFAAGVEGAAPDRTQELLGEALADPATWEPEIRRLDRLSGSFGLASPRSLAQLEAQTEELSALSEQLNTYAKRWRYALEALRRENLNAFLAANPEWKPRLSREALGALDPVGRRTEAAALLAELAPFTEAAPERAARLRELHAKASEAKDARYHSEVRIAALIRLHAILKGIAGRHYLAAYASVDERNAISGLETCEDLALGAAGARALAEASEPPEAFPPLAEEYERLQRVVPGWLGIRYRPPRGSEKELDLPSGAVVVSTVFPDSPAAGAKLQVADIVLGPPGSPFTEPHALREWVMRGELAKPAALRVLRDGREVQVEPSLASYPLKLPALPAPPRVGGTGPGLDLDFLRADYRLPKDGSRLLFFWATWCGPCKAALSRSPTRRPRTSRSS
jgi:hypothetical protein